jgi:copper chaperone CopZ
LAIPAIHCDGCLSTVRKTVEGVGAQYVSGDADVKRVALEADPETVSVAAIMEALEAIGFPATIDGSAGESA